MFSHMLYIWWHWKRIFLTLLSVAIGSLSLLGQMRQFWKLLTTDAKITKHELLQYWLTKVEAMQTQKIQTNSNMCLYLHILCSMTVAHAWVQRALLCSTLFVAMDSNWISIHNSILNQIHHHAKLGLIKFNEFGRHINFEKLEGQILSFNYFIIIWIVKTTMKTKTA